MRFEVLSPRQVVKEKVAAKRIDTSVRKTIVNDNCNAVWQYTQTVTKKARRNMALMTVKEYPFLKQAKRSTRGMARGLGHFERGQ